MRTTLLAILLAAFALTASAHSVAIEPPNPDSITPINIIVGGYARTGCIPRIQQPTVNGNDVSVRLLTPIAACTLAVTPYVQSVRMAPLPPGTYHLHVTVVDGTPEFVDRDFFVSDAEAPFSVVPKLEMSSGRETVEIRSAGAMEFTPASKVRFGVLPAEAIQYVSPSVLRVVTPLHTNATYDYDVTVDGRTVKRAYIGVNSSNPPDEGLFATILIPLLYEGAGANGSRWTTDLFVRNDNSVQVVGFNHLRLDPCGDFSCPKEIPAKTTVQIKPNPPMANGYLFRPSRDLLPNLHFSARVRNANDPNDGGAELPIVRESDFRRGTIVLPRVPLRAGARATLRAYVLDNVAFLGGESFGAAVSVFVDGIGVRAPQLAWPLNYSEPWRGSVEISGTEPVEVRVTSHPFARIWAFVSITDNVTQRVTIVTPNE